MQRSLELNEADLAVSDCVLKVASIFTSLHPRKDASRPHVVDYLEILILSF